jgi:hypothetical protein
MAQLPFVERVAAEAGAERMPQPVAPGPSVPDLGTTALGHAARVDRHGWISCAS